MDQKNIDQKVINLYDSYTHGSMNRRTFFDRLVILAGGTAAATAMLSLLQNNYAKAETVAADDSVFFMKGGGYRVKIMLGRRYVPQATSTTIRVGESIRT